MAQLTDLYIKKETLETLLKGLEAKREKGISLLVSINDEANNFGQNVSVSVNQTKEQRDANKPKFYVGNGKTFWSNKGEFIAPKQPKEQGNEDDNLPF